MFILVAVAYIFSISDQIVSGINNNIPTNPYTTAGFNAYVSTIQGIMFVGIVDVLFPFMVFLAFVSSFIDRRQDLIGYLVTAMATSVITPLIVYLFSTILTNMLNVTILNPNYIRTTYFQYFLFIMVANLLLSLCSFVFVQRGRSVA